MTKEQKYKKVLEKIKYLIENSIGINPNKMNSDIIDKISHS